MAWLRGQPLPVSPLPAAGPGVFSTAAWTAPWPHPGQPQPRPRQGQLPWGSGPGPSKGNCVRGTQATPHPTSNACERQGRAGGQGWVTEAPPHCLGRLQGLQEDLLARAGASCISPRLPWCLAWNVCLVSSYEHLERRAEADQGGVENLSEKVTLLFLPLLL